MNDTTVTVLLTGDDNETVRITCPDEATARRLGWAAVGSDGGVGAWLLDTAPVLPFRPEQITALEAGHTISDLLELAI